MTPDDVREGAQLLETLADIRRDLVDLDQLGPSSIWEYEADLPEGVAKTMLKAGERFIRRRLAQLKITPPLIEKEPGK